MLKGSVKIVFRNCKSFEKTREDLIADNIIFNQSLRNLFRLSPFPSFNPLFANARIYLSSDTSVPGKSDTSVPGIFAIGAPPSGSLNAIWYENISPNFGEIFNRINATSSDRTFHKVGLINGSFHISAILLSLPCTQKAFEILDIYYRIQIIPDQYLLARFYQNFGAYQFIENMHPDLFRISPSYSNVPIQNYDYPFQRNPHPLVKNLNLIRYNSDFYKIVLGQKYSIENSGISGDTDDAIGLIFNAIFIGDCIGSFSHSAYIPGDSLNRKCAFLIRSFKNKYINIDPLQPQFNPPFQKIWSHRSSATKPFFEPGQASIGSAYPSISGSWQGKIPEFYKYEIMNNSGDYKFSRKYFLGFSGNSYINEYSFCHFINPNIPAFSGFHNYDSSNNYRPKYSESKIIFYDQSGITILDIFDGSYKIFDADSSPALGADNIQQVECADNQIYIACKNSGLWKIDYDSDIVSQILNIPCFGVDVGSDRIIAIFDGSLRDSTDWSASLSISFSLWNNVFFIRCDRASNELAIVYRNASNNTQILWYNLNTNTQFQGPVVDFFYSERHPGLLNVAAGFWAGPLQKYNFGSLSVSNLPERGCRQINFFGDLIISRSGLIRNDLSFATNYSNISDLCTHLIGGICLLEQNRIKQIFSFNDSYGWENYGWNGSDWILNFPNAKATHSAIEPLIGGLNIKWNSGDTSIQFYSGDYFTQAICWGICKDNATVISLEYYIYLNKAYFNQDFPITVIPASLELPFPAASNVNFYTIDIDTLYELNEFFINGGAVASIYTDNTPPGPNEIRIIPINSGSQQARIIFNSADAGKSFSGKYTWISQ